MSIEDSLNFRRVAETVTTSGSVAADDLRTLQAAGYEAVINLLPFDSDYAVDDEAGIVTGQGLAYVQIPVDFAAPTAADLDAFIAAMDAQAGRTVHVHCAANYRVSAFYSLYALAAGIWSTEQADEHLADVWGADTATYPVWPEFIASQRARLAR